MIRESSAQNPSRRAFYGTFIQILGGLMAAVVAAPAAAYLFLKPKSSGVGDLVEVADLADLPAGMPQEVVYYRTRVDGWKRSREKATAWVVKTADDKAVAFSPTCPHLGCVYHWEAERTDAQGQAAQSFVCPCHASTFSAKGEVLGGPAPRPLDRYITRIEGGKLLVGSEIEKG
ncbi:MAG: ubiquinol-cytochrome c reductase iron-sulfur subunit [Bryobacteraceae bacterium]